MTSVIVIDDNEDITDMLSEVLSPLGHEFTYANNGHDGIKLIHDKQFDLVLLDIAMPNFSGKDVVDELVKNGNIKKQPVVLFTASSVNNDEIAIMISKGVSECIRKPVSISKFVDSLKKYEN